MENVKEGTLTGVIWLIGIVRRLETQLASSLCPKPSVPINQMTPAFNIWGLLGWLVKLSFEILNDPSKLQMLKAGVIWLIGTDGSGHNKLASCVPSRRSMPINQMTSRPTTDGRHFEIKCDVPSCSQLIPSVW
ncbi:hypothetical protein TYRP_011021 [Tyrophagus putrescentiae]|nr:hypothetical protein TYRP_011021 [Tyrophagus putrescentiae]